jgi:tetratricopeptide (TPR) repeat protein
MERMNVVELRSRAGQAWHEDRRDDARRDLHEAIARGRVAGNVKELKQSLALLGQIERDDNHLVEAMACYEELVALHLAHNNPVGVASALRYLGDIHGENDSADLAGLCYQEAIAIYDTHADAPPLDVANALRSMAVHQQEAGETGGARNLWQAARNIYSALGVVASVRECDERLGDLQDVLAMAG